MLQSSINPIKEKGFYEMLNGKRVMTSTSSNTLGNHYLTDLKFSFYAMTDASGEVVGSPSVSQEYGYTGRRHDSEDTGLMYFRARYYSSELGRFIGRDPLGYVDGYNLYGAYYVPLGMDAYGKKADLMTEKDSTETYVYFNLDPSGTTDYKGSGALPKINISGCTVTISGSTFAKTILYSRKNSDNDVPVTGSIEGHRIEKYKKLTNREHEKYHRDEWKEMWNSIVTTINQHEGTHKNVKCARAHYKAAYHFSEAAFALNRKRKSQFHKDIGTFFKSEKEPAVWESEFWKQWRLWQASWKQIYKHCF